MYQYDEIDQAIVDARVAQFREQTERFLKGELSEDEYRPLRLQNGLYVQRFAPMLRVAIPYGVLSSQQLHMLADIADKYDRGYGHFSTRQNIQYNWPELAHVPDLLADLATVQMHAIQTSGNCIRNTTSDQYAGVAADEVVDPRPYCELIRQWSTFHPEFAALPRKFKIAVNGALIDRAAIKVHDIGVNLRKNAQGEVLLDVYVGGGLGRTPIIGQLIGEGIAERHLLTYLDSVMRVYNQFGRRDNKYKARIKILVKELGVEAFRAAVEADWVHSKEGPSTVLPAHLKAMKARFINPTLDATLDTAAQAQLAIHSAAEPSFAAWLKRNVVAHQNPNYRAVNLSLKRRGVPPGDATASEMHQIADWATAFSHNEIRVTHEQNLVLPYVHVRDLFTLWQGAKSLGLAQANIGLVSNIIACPGGDFCSLANAKSLPIAEDLLSRYDALDEWFDIGELDINISGCINSCGHHHVGHIGVLGVDKHGEEWYQITLGGHAGNRPGQQAALGKVIGPSFKQEEVVGVVEKIINRYLSLRDSEHERFIDVVERVGLEPFKEHVYATTD
ncbi:MAG: putative sulfite reductase [Pseudomonadota bacterium]